MVIAFHNSDALFDTNVAFMFDYENMIGKEGHKYININIISTHENSSPFIDMIK